MECVCVVWDLFILIQVVECTQTWPSKRGDEIFECAFDWIMAFLFILFSKLRYVRRLGASMTFRKKQPKFDVIVYSCLSVCDDRADEISTLFDFCLISFFGIRVRLHFYGFISTNFYGFCRFCFWQIKVHWCDCLKFDYGLQTECDSKTSLFWLWRR